MEEGRGQVGIGLVHDVLHRRGDPGEQRAGDDAHGLGVLVG